MADVLTRFEFLKRNPLVEELIQRIENFQDEQGRFKVDAVFKEYKCWDFGDKRLHHGSLCYVAGY